MAAVAITCTRRTTNDSIDVASGVRAVLCRVEFEVGRLELAVTVEVAVAHDRRSQCTRIRLGKLYAMEWRGRRTHVTPRWSALSWAAALAGEMRVGETRQFDIGLATPSPR